MTTRGISPLMLAEIQKDTFKPVLLFKFEFDSGTLRLWNGYRDLDFNEPAIGINTYTGSGSLLSVSKIEESLDLKAGKLTVMLTGIDTAIVSIALTENYQGRKMTLWLGALNANEILIDAPVLVFTGKMDVMTLADDNVSATVELTIENEFIELARSKERRYSDEDKELEFPGDRFFEFVPSVQQKEIVLE